MAVATSPYQKNDYQAANSFRPYKLPVNDIVKANSAVNEYWKIGAERINRAYDSVLNLNLTSEENRQVRDNFMKEADKQMTKLSSMNVADASVQRQGLALFNPIMKDRAIVQDDFLTKRYQGVLTEAEKWKKDEKTKGQAYSLDNLAYALRPFKGFGNKTSRTEMEGIFNKAKDASYTPYYDVAKERQEILKNCKPDKMSNTSPSGDYLHTSTNNSLTQSKVWGCLEAGLSDQARQQIRISGTVRYQDNYKAVRDEYISAAADKKSYLEKEKDNYAAQLKAAIATKGDPERIKMLQSLVKQHEDGIADLDTDLKTYNTWDDKYIADRYEDLASTAYFRTSNHAFAEAYAIKDLMEKDAANPISITNITQNGLNNRQIAGFQHDITVIGLEHANEMEKIKTQALLKLQTGKNDDGSDMDPIEQIKALMKSGFDMSTYTGIGVEKAATTSESLNTEIAKYDLQKAQAIESLIADDDIKGLITSSGLKGPDGKILIDPTNPGANNNYRDLWRTLNTYKNEVLAKNPNDPLALKINKAYNNLLVLGNTRDMLNGQLIKATDFTKNQNPEIAKNYEIGLNKIVSSFQPITVNGQTIGKDRIKGILNGTDPQYGVKSQFEESTDAMGGRYQETVDVLYDKKTGFPIISNFAPGKDLRFLQAQKSANFTQKLNETLGGMKIEQHKILNSGNLFTEGSSGMRIIHQLFGNELGVIGKNNKHGEGDVTFNTVGGANLETGKVQIQATDKSGRVSSEDMLKAIKRKAGNAEFKLIDDHTIEITIPELRDLNKPMTYEKVVRGVLETSEHLVPEVGKPAYTEVGVGPTGITYGVKSSKDITGNGVTHSLMVNNKEYSIPNPRGLDEKEALIFALNSGLEGSLDQIILKPKK